MILLLLCAFLGWLVGVAINHAANILPTRQTLLQRPKCPACGTPLPFLAWSALVTQLTGHQTCQQCGHWYPSLARSLVIELITPLFFVFLLERYGLSLQLGILSLYTAILILITVTDLEHRLIFNAVILPAILIAIVAAFIIPDLPWRLALVGGAVAFGLSYLAALLSRGGLGAGDVTLSTFLGLIIGFPLIILSLTFGVFLGGFVAFLLLITRRVGLKTYIPYGPFLTVTGWIMLVWGAEIWQYYFQ